MVMKDDNGTLVSETLEAYISKRAAIPDDLRFPFMTNKMTGQSEPTRTQWLLQYFVYRTAKPNPTEEEHKEYLKRIGVDAEDDIDRFRGALLGAAIGDALGTTLEFKPPGTFPPIDDIVGGGPFRLEPGQWTDDTSMMYCLAHSLVRKKGFDLKDQLELYRRWWKDGVFSVNGECFDIGNTVKSALENYEVTGTVEAGSSDPMSAGNGSLMRLAPVPIFYYDDFEEAVHHGGLSSKTTHRATEAVDACRYFSGLIWGALHGVPKEELLDGIYSPIESYWEQSPLCDSIQRLLLDEAYKTKSASDINPSGYVLHTLEAVLWAFYNSDNFESGALAVVNLGGDADTTGCIYGQIAGAYYGEGKLPFKWIKKLNENHVFYLKAQELKDVILERRTASRSGGRI